MNIQQSALIEFRPLFFAMVFIGILFLLLSLIPKGRNSNVNIVTIVTVSIIQITTGGMLLYIESNLIDRFKVAGDSITLYLFLGVLVLSIINPIIFRMRNSKRGKSRYRYR